jgi:hypothetical protein
MPGIAFAVLYTPSGATFHRREACYPQLHDIGFAVEIFR